MLYVVNVTWVI